MGYTAHVKGAPNFIIDKMHAGRCTHYIAADGSELELTDEIRAAYMKKVDALSSQALRVLAIATRRNVPFAAFGAEGLDTDDKFKNIVTGLTLCGLCASIDPERDGVKGAVKTAKTAGLRVVMITGDYLPTAIAIAKNINIISDDITSDTRSSCTIWPSTGAMTPSLDLDCATWTACTTTVGDAMYNAGCAAWTTQAQYSVAGQAVIADAARDAVSGATGAIYTKYGNSDCNICIDESIRRARTCAFIALVWAEGFRAYVSRSFENPVWVDTFANPSMNKAVLLAQLTLGLALFIPGLSDSVLGLYVYEIHGFGWFLAAMGSISCLVFCELFKCWSKRFVELAKIVDYTEDEDGNQQSSTEPSTKVEEPVEEKKEPVGVSPVVEPVVSVPLVESLSPHQKELAKEHAAWFEGKVQDTPAQ